jgi:hypothetical protein
MFLKPVKPSNPVAVPQPESTLTKAEQFIALKGKTKPTWESIVNAIETGIAAFEEIFGGLQASSPTSSATVAPKSTKVALKG